MKTTIWILLSVLACAVTWLYTARVLGPWEHYVNVERGNLKNQMGDLYSPWMGTRELLLHGSNPYGPEVSHEIQMAFYGRAIAQSYREPGANVINEQRFAYPVYVVFLLAPTVHADFQKLQVWAAATLAVLTALSVLLWIEVLRWQPSKALIATLILFTLSTPQVMQGLRLRQLGLVVAFLLAVSAWCVIRNHLALAGIALALSTIKPQMVVLPLAWFLLWSVSAWPRRWPLLAGFSITLATLIALGELLLPGWPHFFLNGLLAYRNYVATPSILSTVLGGAFGLVVSGIIVVGMLAFAWRNRQADAASPEFIQVLTAFLLGAALVLPLMYPFNQVLLLLPAMMIARDWLSLPRLLRRVLAVVVAWPWVARFVLLLLPPRLDSMSRLPLLPSALTLFVPILLSMLFAISWSKATQFPPQAPDLPLS
jgi:hypothetical protein